VAKEIDFVTGTIVTADFLDYQQEVESALAWGIRVYKSGANTLTLPMALEGTTSSASIRINGKPRFTTSPIVLSLAGNPDGTYNIYATAGAGPAFTLRASTGAATADERKIAEADFAANAITTVRNMVDAVSGHNYQHRAGGQDELNLSGYDPLTVTSLTATKAGATTLALTSATVGTGITVGGDTNLYRSATNEWTTDDSVIVALNLTVNGNTRLGNATTDTVGFHDVAGQARQAATADIKDVLAGYGLLTNAGASPLNLDGGTLTAGTINGTAYQVSGVALAASNLSNGTTGSGSVVLATSPTVSGMTHSGTLALGTTTVSGTPSFSGTLTTVNLTATGNVRLGDATTDTVGFHDAAGQGRQAATADIKDVLAGYGLLTNGGASPLDLDLGTLTAGQVVSRSSIISDLGSGTGSATLSLWARNAGVLVPGEVSQSATGVLNIVGGNTNGVEIFSSGSTSRARFNSTGIGFFGVTPVARPAARTMTNWTVGSNADRAIDRNSYTLQELFDYVMTMTYDLQQYGLLQ
jgi:hypothetical protein